MAGGALGGVFGAGLRLLQISGGAYTDSLL